jgi:hypothetical protein
MQEHSYKNGNGALKICATTGVHLNPLVSIGNGRALFRADDLCELAGLVRRLSSRGGNDV